MNNNESYEEVVISNNICDVCGLHGSGVSYYRDGLVRMFVCCGCDRPLFDLVGERDKELWLNGEF